MNPSFTMTFGFWQRIKLLFGIPLHISFHSCSYLAEKNSAEISMSVLVLGEKANAVYKLGPQRFDT